MSFQSFIGSSRAIVIAATVAVAACNGSPGGFAESPALFSEVTVACVDGSSDSDGDGWGWENEKPCKVAVDELADVGDLPVGIVYYLWHCITKTNPYQNRFSDAGLSGGEEYNIFNVLTGNQSDWGDEFFFHWWDEPDEGYYCLGDEPDTIRKHLIMLRDAGIDFLALDFTNHPNIQSLSAEVFIHKSLVPLLEAAQSIDGAPKIVPWVPFAAENFDTLRELERTCDLSNSQNKCNELVEAHTLSMYDYITNLLKEDYPDLVFNYQDKPLLLETSNYDMYSKETADIVRPELEKDWTVRPTWGLSQDSDEWQFLSVCNDAVEFYNSNGWSANGCNQPINAGEQISVAPAYQYTYISEPFEQSATSPSVLLGGMPKFHGRTLAQQFRTAFENRSSKPVVLITGWNEWIASRFVLDGRNAFVDLYDFRRNRDIEPGGLSGDYYYYLMRTLIAKYRSGVAFDFDDYFLTANNILDTDYYWNAYQDLQNNYQRTDTAGLSAHWLRSGMTEGRQPSVVFSTEFYAAKYPDLANGGVTSSAALLQHFLDSGFQEGRQGSAQFLASDYLKKYAKLSALFGSNGYYQAFRYFITEGQYPPDNHDPLP